MQTEPVNCQYKRFRHGGEEFKCYLNDKKVMDSFSRLIVSLYEKPEKPPDPVTYIRDFFAPDTGGIDIISVRAENAETCGTADEGGKTPETTRAEVRPTLSPRRYRVIGSCSKCHHRSRREGFPLWCTFAL
jgi:hypothetical protein